MNEVIWHVTMSLDGFITGPDDAMEWARSKVAEIAVASREVTGAPTPITGRCLCGAVTYSADSEPVVQAVCYCTDCQRQTGNPFSVIVGVPRAAFKVDGSTLASFVTTGEDHGGDTERNFCSACGSPVFSIAAVAPALAFIKAGSLDDSSWLEPAVEAWTSSAQPWAPHFEHTVQFERGPQ